MEQHWLTAFRRAHGLSVEQLGAAIRRLGAQRTPEIGCSNLLLDMLECVKGFRTVPAIANLIAEACGATAAQRDALTLPKHAGTWTPKGKPAGIGGHPRPGEKAVKEAKAPAKREKTPAKLPIRATNELARSIRQPAVPPSHSTRKRPVVAIDTDGQARATYSSITHAAYSNDISREMVLKRCRRQIKSDEFAGLKYTFRFKDEWEGMTAEQRRADTSKKGRKPRRSYFRYAVVVIDPEGHELGRYSNGTEAAKAMGESCCAVLRHCALSVGLSSHYTRKGRGYFYADEWDGMDEEAKAAATLRRRGG